MTVATWLYVCAAASVAACALLRGRACAPQNAPSNDDLGVAWVEGAYEGLRCVAAQERDCRRRHRDISLPCHASCQCGDDAAGSSARGGAAATCVTCAGWFGTDGLQAADVRDQEVEWLVAGTLCAVLHGVRGAGEGRGAWLVCGIASRPRGPLAGVSPAPSTAGPFADSATARQGVPQHP